MKIHNPGQYQVSLKIILKNTEGKILILKNAAGTGEQDYYDLPGGRINKNEFETPYETLITRELAEEVGKKVTYELSLDPVSFARHSFFSKRTKKDTQVLYLVFEARYLSGDVSISDEHSDFQWVFLEKLSLKKYFWKGMLEALERYIALTKNR